MRPLQRWVYSSWAPAVGSVLGHEMCEVRERSVSGGADPGGSSCFSRLSDRCLGKLQASGMWLEVRSINPSASSLFKR